MVRGTVGYPQAATVKLAAGGRVTAVAVVEGGRLREGQTVLRVDGRPVVAVGGRFPFWRDLAAGATGEDVRQLERMLARTGHRPGRVDDRFTSSTRAALRRWQNAHGLGVDGVFRVGDTLVASLPARVGAVKVAVGDFATAGTDAVTLTDATQSVQVDLTPGERARVAAGQRAIVEVTATGVRLDGTVRQVSSTLVTGTSGSAGSAGSSAGSGSSGGSGDGSGSGSGGQQNTGRYPARITLAGDAGPVDGVDARVTIVRAETAGVLTVPVAAVVLNGQGNPVVRVLTNGATVVRPVRTGLTEGAYVQVSGDLREGQSVILADGGPS